MLYQDKMIFDGRMLRMIIRSIVEDARVLDNTVISRPATGLHYKPNQLIPGRLDSMVGQQLRARISPARSYAGPVSFLLQPLAMCETHTASEAAARGLRNERATTLAGDQAAANQEEQQA